MNDRIHTAGLITPVEVIRRRSFHTWAPGDFCMEMLKIYGCKPVSGDSFNLISFLIDIFWAGWVAGIRHERARRRKGGAAA